MKNTTYLKEVMAKNIQIQLNKKGITQTDMAKDLNIPEMTVSNWIKAKTYPRIDKIQMMADYFGIPRSELTEVQGTDFIKNKSELVAIPILGEIACGIPILATNNYNGYRYEPEEYAPKGNLFYLKTKGDSMEPTIPNGSYVLIREQPDVECGEIAAVLVNGDTEATLKRVKKQGKTIILIPDNPKHEPIIACEDYPIKIIGKAIRFTKDL